jgi:hypothetical protein
MRAIGAPIAELAAARTHRKLFIGRFPRLRAGPYRVVYVVEEDLTTVERVDRACGA